MQVDTNETLFLRFDRTDKKLAVGGLDQLEYRIVRLRRGVERDLLLAAPIIGETCLGDRAASRADDAHVAHRVVGSARHGQR